MTVGGMAVEGRAAVRMVIGVHAVAPGTPLKSIGEVLAELRPEFPDVTISKLRFLEAERLVEPLRAPSGYRKYTAAHVQRLGAAASRHDQGSLGVLGRPVQALGGRQGRRKQDEHCRQSVSHQPHSCLQ